MVVRSRKRAMNGGLRANDLSTADSLYATRLVSQASKWWKRTLDVQAPYRWNLRRLKPGFTFDIGCGIGRNLVHLNLNGVGIDHNLRSIEIARSRGVRAFTPEEFENTSFNKRESFDSILLAHVAEHMPEGEVVELLERYIHLLRAGGKLIIITPQEYGYRSDPTHVQFMDFEALARITAQFSVVLLEQYSFPFPRIFGRLFKYNEFVFVCKKHNMSG